MSDSSSSFFGMSIPKDFDVPLSVVLVQIGSHPEKVAALFQEHLNLTILDLEYLEDSLPLVLFKTLDMGTALKMRVLFSKAGATVSLRYPRKSKQGLKFGFRKKDGAA